MAKKVPKIKEVMADNLIRMLIDGPEVSFNGSPTVSPQTAALCSSVEFPSLSFLVNLNGSSFLSEWSGFLEKLLPFSIYFLVLSQAPPVLENEKAIYTPDTMIPAKSPLTASGPKKRPVKKGVKRTKSPGATILEIEALVEISIHFW